MQVGENSKPLVFIIGAPRSGSSWLQRLMGSSSEIAAIDGELTLFSRYIAPFIHAYEQEEKSNRERNWNQGLPVVMSRQEVDEYIGQLVSSVYSKIDSQNAKVILDKHPHYSEHIDLIDYYVPGSKFINIIRDGREVALSWNRVHATEGFGASTFSKACSDWKKFVNAAKQARKLGEDRYLEVYYHDLVNDTYTQLHRIFAFCGLNYSVDQVRAMAEHKKDIFVSAPDLRIKADLRGKRNVIWQEKLSEKEIYLFNLIAGDLLIEYGFEPDYTWTGSAWNRFYQKCRFKLGI